MLTATREAELLEALGRAIGQGIRVQHLGGPTWWASSSDPDKPGYLIWHAADRATCSCPAGAANRMCKHLAAVIAAARLTGVE